MHHSSIAVYRQNIQFAYYCTNFLCGVSVNAEGLSCELGVAGDFELDEDWLQWLEFVGKTSKKKFGHPPSETIGGITKIVDQVLD